jgi:parallel beta-helix repeat protein
MKSNSRSTVIERNQIARCHIGIAFGGDGPARPAHLGGIVRNNLIHDSTETGIFIVNTAGGEVIHNTLFSNGEAIRIAQDKFQPGGQNYIDILNNILGGPILITGDYRGALRGNYLLKRDMASQIFQNPSDRNFRLNSGASALIDQAVKTQNEVSRDYGGAPWPQGSGTDIGAFEYRPDN